MPLQTAIANGAYSKPVYTHVQSVKGLRDSLDRINSHRSLLDIRFARIQIKLRIFLHHLANHKLHMPSVLFDKPRLMQQRLKLSIVQLMKS